MGRFKCHCGAILSALVTRLLFAAHCLVAFLWIAITNPWNMYYILLATGLLLLFIETLYTLIARKGAEYKWFCPSVFCYLLTIVPCIWVIELTMLDARLESRDEIESEIETDLGNLSSSSGGDEAALDLNSTILNSLTLPSIEPTQMVVLIEQLLLFILILGRWLLPKGDISRNELSQLLLVYIGMAADIIEFFEAFKEETVAYNRTLIITILAIWSGSLLQFCLVLTASKSKKSRAGFTDQVAAENADEDEEEEDTGCFDTEVFGIMTTVFLQDGSFLTLRLLLLIKYNVHSYMHIFFTVKNSLIMLLMVYRLFVIFDAKRDKKLEGSKEYLDLDAREKEKQKSESDTLVAH